MPHPLDQERPFERLVLQPVRELEPGGILRPERFALVCRPRCRFRDPGLGVHLGGLGRLDGRLRHLLIVRNLAPCDKGGFMSGRRDARVRISLRLDANHQMRIVSAALGHEERVDFAGLANQRDVGGDALGDGLEESEMRGSGQMPVLGIPHDEIQHGFRRG